MIPVTYIITIQCLKCQFTDAYMAQTTQPTKHYIIKYIHRNECDECFCSYLNRAKPCFNLK